MDSTPHAHADAKITILLVDDDADCRMLIHEAISESKVSNEVHEVSDGRAALRFLQAVADDPGRLQPGLIYMDVEMPGMGGLECLRQIRADARLKDIPVVMMTGVAEAEQMRLAAAYGANSYTLKPANAEQFLRTVLASTDYWLNIHQYPKHHAPQEVCRR